MQKGKKIFAGGRRKVVIAILFSLLMVLVAFAAMGYAPSPSAQQRVSAVNAVTPAASSSSTAWTYPTTTMQEPGYTNGTYIMASTNSVEHLNIYKATDVYSFYLLDEIYDTATNLLPNETISPWLATNWSEKSIASTTDPGSTYLGLTNASSHYTYDPLNGTKMPVNYVYRVNIRPGVQWTDFPSSGGNSASYTYSNVTTFNGPSGKPYTISYRYRPMTMKTYYVQSADFILSWKILQSSADYGGSFANVVNVVPVSNTTVDFYLSSQSATFVTYTLETPILPYHIWVKHDFASSPGVWNYTTGLSASQASLAYNSWNMGYSSSTGVASGLVGTGPFMMNGGYGMPAGDWTFDHHWYLYVNPHYFVQYTKSLRKWTPKFYELYVPRYLSLSSAVVALSLHQVYQIEGGVTPTYIPTLATVSDSYLYDKPTTGYGYIQLNPFNQQEANNTTAQYGFTPTEIGVPLNITTVRQALDYAVNKVYLNTVVAEGYGIPGTSVVPDSDSVWQNHSLNPYTYNPAKAMQLLNSTKGMNYTHGEYYYHGVQFTMDIQITSAASNPNGVEGALLIQKWWDAIGVKTTVTQEAFSTIDSNVISYGYKAIELGITGIEGDPTGDYVTFYTPEGYGSGFYLGPFTGMYWNGTYMNGTAIDKLMTSLYNTLNTNTNLTYRIQISNEIQAIAANESTMINIGYGIDLFPIVNSTFVNITKDTLSQTGFEYWNFMSLHLRSHVSVTPPSKVPEKLSVGVITQKQVFFNSEYGNVTVQVRNQYGSAVSGANVTLGVNPSGALLNITSLSGVTNSKGIYVLEFQVLSNQPLIYTSDYTGEINISAAASMPSAPAGTVIPGIGSTYIDVSPEPVAYKVVNMPNLNLTGTQKFKNLTIEVYNPLNNKPISGYSYTVQVNSGALNMTNYSSSALTSLVGNPLNEMYAPINYGNSNAGYVKMAGYSSVEFTPNGTFAVALNNASSGNGKITLVNLTNATALSSGLIKPGKNFIVGKAPSSMQIVQIGSNKTSVWAFVTNYGSENVTAVNLTSGKTLNIKVGGNPTGIVLALNGVNDSFAYVANHAGNVTVLNLTNMSNIFSTDNLILGASTDPNNIQLSSSGNYALVSDTGTGNVSVLNLTNATGKHWKVNGNISLGHDTKPMGLVVSGNVLYVEEYGTNNVSAVDLVNLSYNASLKSVGYVNYSLVTNISLGSGMTNMTLAGDFLLVGNSRTDNVTAIDTVNISTTYSTMNTIVDNITTTSHQLGLASMGSLGLAISTSNLTLIGGENKIIFQQYNMEQVIGTTNSTGMFTVGLQMVPNSTADYNLMGSNLTSYMFLGDYLAGAPMSGATPYMTIAQLTSATNVNKFGTMQPVELPVQTTTGSSQYTISISPSSYNLSSPSGSTQINVTVVNKTGAPVKDFSFELVSQNALGANRGYFSGSGNVIQVPNLNGLFASTELPGIQLTTNAKGIATAMFNAGMYNVETSNGNFIGYSPQSFTDPYYVPADVFQLSAIGLTSTISAVATVNSSQMVNNVAPSPVLTAYLPGSQLADGVTTITSGTSYTMYLNSTYNTAAGTSAPNVGFTVTVSYGTLSTSSNTTNGNGTYALKYTAPTVSVLTPVTITITGNGQTFVEHVYVTPKAPTSQLPLYYALIGIFAALFVIFAAMYALQRRKVNAPPKEPQTPP
jgi:ABC-type transport system substrate-binding protein